MKHDKNKPRVITASGREAMSAGGKRASRKDKQRAGRRGYEAMIRKVVAQALNQPTKSLPVQTRRAN